jgi:hypothetical protein
LTINSENWKKSERLIVDWFTEKIFHVTKSTSLIISPKDGSNGLLTRELEQEVGTPWIAGGRVHRPNLIIRVYEQYI